MRKVTALAIMLAVVLGSQFMIWQGRSDVAMTREVIAGTPVDFFRAAGSAAGSVVVVHGFAANREMMRSWGLSLARQGLDVYVVDQAGHGDSRQPLPVWSGGNGPNPLAAQLKALLDRLVEQGRVEPGQIALIGHSMGGSTVTALGLDDSRIRATVTLSSAHRGQLPPDRPSNLLTLIAQREPRFITAAAQELAAGLEGGSGSVGRQSGSFEQGTARLVSQVPGRNHITIIFDAAVKKQAADWIHASFGTAPAPASAPAQHWWWVLAGLLGALGAVVATAAMLAPSHGSRYLSSMNRPGWLAGVVALMIAALSAVMAVVYLRLPWIGLAVVDYLLPFFLVMAAVLLLLRLLWPRDFGFPVLEGAGLSGGGLLRGMGVFAAYAGAVVPVIHLNLSNHTPTVDRLLPMLLFALALWLFFVQEEALKRAVADSYGLVASLTMGLLGKMVLVATLYGSAALPNPQPFLSLTIPVMILLLLIIEFFSGLMLTWRYSAVAAATFTSLMLAWTTAVTFPFM